MNLTTFNFNQVNVRTVTDDQGNPWFVAADLLEIMSLDRKALERVDADDKGVSQIHTPGGKQNMTTVNESGMYSLVLSSVKPDAKAFKKWVTSEVLPTIRKTGSYSVKSIQEQSSRIPLDEIARSLEVANNMLNVCPSGKLKSLRQLYDNYGVNSNILPSYTIDAPTVTAGSSEPTISITEMLKRTDLNISPVMANKKLESLGMIRKEYRTSTRGNGVKNFWSVTNEGLQYGKNVTSDRNQTETQPHWYVSKMNDLIRFLSE